VSAEGRRRVAEETVAIVAAGGYDAPSGHRVDIAADVAAAVAGTTLYLPDDPVPAGGAANPSPLIEVTSESTVDAGRRLGEDAVALVFASARNPGGGFLRGTKAQEEDIARASALHACLSAVPEFYAFHRGERDLRYSDRVIYSPRVPVFRVDTSALLDVPRRLSMITAAAPNLGAIRLNQPHLVDSVPAAIATRARRVLAVAAAHGHRRIVLGAWGCGVFANDPAVVATAFAAALRDVPRFDHVVFGVLERDPAPTRRTFADVLCPDV